MMRNLTRGFAAIALLAALAGCGGATTDDQTFDKDDYASALLDKAEAYRTENGTYPRSIDMLGDVRPDEVANVWFMTSGSGDKLCIEVVTLKGRATVYSDQPDEVINAQCDLSHFE